MFRISPDDTIVEQVTGRAIHKYDIGDPESTFEVDQFLLGAGIGVTGHLRQATAARVRDDGLVELKCEGNYGIGMPSGNWVVVTERDPGQLARSATFRTDSHTWAIIEMKSSGSVEREGLTLADKGTILYPGGAHGPEDEVRIDVTLSDFSRKADAELLDEARKTVEATFPPGTPVLDNRAQAPRSRYTVGEEPED